VDPTDENGPEEDSTDENGPEEDSTDENGPEEDSIDENTPEEDSTDENVPQEDLTDEDGSLDGDEGDESTDGEQSTDLSDETEKDDSQPPAEEDVKEEKENDDDTTTKHLMMGKEERAAFDEHNRIRTNPKDIIPLVEDQIRRFDETGKFMTIGKNLRLKTNEGISAWDEAVEVLKDQDTFTKLQWNDFLALAAQDHCNEQGHLGTTGHDSADGRKFTDRISKYGFWSGQAGENLAYSNNGGDE